MPASSPSRGAALVARALLVAIGLHFVTSSLLGPLVRPYAWSDFATFYAASQNFANGLDPYDRSALLAAGRDDFGGWIGGYYYPPPFAAVAVRPLAALPFDTARRLWVLGEAIAFVVALALLARRLGADATMRAAGVAALGLLYAPMALDLRLGSVSGILLLLVAAFLHEWHRRHRARAAALLAAAALLKVAPVLLLVYLAVRGEWRFVLRTVASALGIMAACLPWTGIDAWIGWATRVVPYLLSGNFSWFTNQSIDAFFWRLFVPNPDTSVWLASPTLQRTATALVAAVLLGLVVRLAWRSRGEAPHGERFDGEVGLVLVVAVLLSRVAWEYLAVLALPAFVFGLAKLLGGEARPGQALLLGLAWALCALPFPYAEHPVRQGIGLLLVAPRTYGMLLLVGLTASFLARGRAAHEMAVVRPAISGG